MKATLIVAEGRHSGELIAVTGRKFLIGRNRECQLRPGGSTVSQHHCALRKRGDKLFVKDLGSANGTFVNGQRLTREAELHHEDALRVGGLTFLVWIEPGAGPGDTPAESSILDLLLSGSSADSSLGVLPDDSECAGTVVESADRLAKRAKRKAKKDAKAATPPPLPPAVREMLERFRRTSKARG